MTLLKWLCIVLTLWVVANGLISAYETISTGEQSLNTGGYMYDANGEVIGLWDGHTGNSDYSLLEKFIIVIASITAVEPFPIVIAWLVVSGVYLWNYGAKETNSAGTEGVE